MKTSTRFSTLLLTIALPLCVTSFAARADSNDAMCNVRKDHHTKEGASGPCTFSQRQGYIDIDLRIPRPTA